jgi:hypothetical protein
MITPEYGSEKMIIDAAIKDVLKGYPRCVTITVLIGDFPSEYKITKISKMTQFIANFLGQSKVPPPEKSLTIFVNADEIETDISTTLLTAIAAKHSVIPYGVAESLSGQAILETVVNWQVEESMMFVMFKKDLWKSDRQSEKSVSGQLMRSFGTE